NLISFERHRHAARPAARARELVALYLNRVFLFRPCLELRAAEEEVVLVDDVIAVRRELLGGAHIPLVEHDDSWRERECIRAVGPLFALLVDRFLSAAVNRVEIEAVWLQLRQ